MNRMMIVATILVLIAGTSIGDQAAKSVKRPLRLSVRLLELPKQEEGKKQEKTRIFDNDYAIQENERFNCFGGGQKKFTDSGETFEWGERLEGKVKFTDPQNVIVDLKVTVSRAQHNTEPSREFQVLGENYQVHSKLKLDERVVIMLTRPGEGRPRWLEIKVSLNDR